MILQLTTEFKISNIPIYRQLEYMDLPAYPKCFTKRQLLSTPNSSQKQTQFQEISCRVDEHNLKLIEKWKNSDNSIKADNLLVKQYTQAVYQKYQIKNHFDRQNNSSTKIETNKKSIRLSKRLNTSTSSLSSPQYSNNKENETKFTNSIMQGKAENGQMTKTPDKKFLKIKKSEHVRSTAHSHMRSKTGLASLQSGELESRLQSNDFNHATEQRQELRSGSVGKGKNSSNVQVSEFDEFSVVVQESKIQSKIDKSSIENNVMYASKFTSTLCSPRSYLCPICEQKMQEQQIKDHEQACQQLQTLYSLTKPQLHQYLQWKINEHLSNLITIITNIKIKRNVSANTNRNRADNDKQPKCQRDIQNPDVAGIQIQMKNMSQFEDVVAEMREVGDWVLEGSQRDYVEAVMGQCQQEITKCIWFQHIKQNLDTKHRLTP